MIRGQLDKVLSAYLMVVESAVREIREQLERVEKSPDLRSARIYAEGARGSLKEAEQFLTEIRTDYPDQEKEGEGAMGQNEWKGRLHITVRAGSAHEAWQRLVSLGSVLSDMEPLGDDNQPWLEAIVADNEDKLRKGDAVD